MKMNAIVILLLLLKAVVSQPLQIPDADDQLHIYALPVGQGDCTVIQCPKANGGPTKGVVTIIDAGASNSKGIDGQGIVEFLTGTELNFVVLTHSHIDHINYIDDILDHYEEQVPVYHSCDWSTYESHVKSGYALHIQVDSCNSIAGCGPGLSLCTNADVKLNFVASAVGRCAGNPNQDSVISKITYAGTSTLITGDFELTPNNMTVFLQTARPDLKSDIYRLSHHGAYNGLANQVQFLDAVGAIAVFSSSGYQYNHPRCEVYDYYDAVLPDNAVDVHPYTCFTPNEGARNFNTKKAIYVTSLIRHDNNNNLIFSFYLLKFSFSSNGGALVDFDHIGDEPPN